MDDGASSTVLWLLLGAVLGVALLALVTLLAVLAARRRAARPTPEPERDDLATFREHPPGFPGGSSPGGDGWASLAPAPEQSPRAEPRFGNRTLGVLAGAAAVVLLTALTVSMLAAADRSPEAADQSAEPEGVEARMTFGGLVLERRAVGVTATYPRVELTSDGTDTIATVELPTWNCLTDEAPADPEAAGCTRSVTEHAELATPELEVSTEDGAVRASGDFATHVDPNGSDPEPTGRTYRLTVTAEPEASGAGWVPADGVLALGDDGARTVEGELRVGD